MKRLENGLIDGINYIRDEKTGKIDWFKMIPQEYLYINQDKKNQLEKRLNKSFAEIKIEEVKEIDLILTLQGIRWLLDTRGYRQVKMHIDIANQEYAAATCEITFIPNEEENFEQIFPASACAHTHNTKSFYSNYLVEAATNRALCRAVRNYLRVGVVSKEELGANDDSSNEKPSADVKKLKMLIDLMDKKKIKWEHIIHKLKSENKYNEEWKKIEDLPNDMIFDLIERIKKANLPAN